MKHILFLFYAVMICSCTNQIELKNTVWDEVSEDGISKTGSYSEFNDSTLTYYEAGYKGSIIDSVKMKYTVIDDTLKMSPSEEYITIESIHIVGQDTIFSAETGKPLFIKRK